MSSFTKKITLSNLSSKKQALFGGSDDLEPILYQTFDLPALKEELNLLADLRSNLQELESLVGEISYLNKEVSNIIKK